MRSIVTFILACLLAGSACLAQSREARLTADEMSRAATAKAVAGLYGEVSSLPVGGRFTAGDLFAQTRSADHMLTVLAQAQLIGGPRWIDEKTCQVQLDISGIIVRHTLMNIAAANPGASPVTAADIERASAGWAKETLSATGTSTSATSIGVVRPIRLAGPWRSVSDKTCRATIAAAKEDAIRRVMDSIRPIAINGRKIGDAMEFEPVSRDIRDYLAAQPVDQIDFRDDLSVAVSLSVPEHELFRVVGAALHRQDRIPLPRDQEAWQRVETEFVAKVARPVGRAMAEQTVPSQPAVLRLPRTAPEWTLTHLESQGFADRGGSKLMVASQADADARSRLRAQIDALPLGKGLTVGEAAKRDRLIEASVSRAISHARVTKTKYLAGGGAQVWIDLDLRDVWDQLQR